MGTERGVCVCVCVCVCGGGGGGGGGGGAETVTTHLFSWLCFMLTIAKQSVLPKSWQDLAEMCEQWNRVWERSRV